MKRKYSDFCGAMLKIALISIALPTMMYGCTAGILYLESLL